MMKKSLALALFGLFLLAPLAASATPRGAAGAQKEVVVGAGETQDKIFSLGGHVVVDGEVREDVMVIGGSITVSGTVGQSVVGIGSRILVKSTAVIKEDLAALGGTLEKEAGCSIGGDTIYFQTRELGDKIFRDNGFFQGLFSLSLIPVIVIFKLIFIFLWFMAALLGASLFPKPLAYAAGEIRQHFWPVLGTGLVALMVFFTLLVFTVLLSFILIGIPIAMALVAAGFAIWLFGRLAVLYFLGMAILANNRGRAVSALSAMLMGLVVSSIAGFVPVLGFLFTLAMNAVGWGVALRTKFGSRENWFVKSAPKPGC
ncbi:MAG: hypothetical protein GX465_01800 [Acidobacteria bacterium]|nr:hypothetical protein [Acidobacteriota bacterium]